MHREGLPGTREILPFPYLKKPVGEAGRTKPWLVVGSAGRGRERNKQREDGTGGRGNEPPGMDGRKSECPTVPKKPGNRTQRDPVEGEGRREHGAGGGKDGEGIGPRKRLNETASDS
jgi:hypothetical protein